MPKERPDSLITMRNYIERLEERHEKRLNLHSQRIDNVERSVLIQGEKFSNFGDDMREIKAMMEKNQVSFDATMNKIQSGFDLKIEEITKGYVSKEILAEKEKDGRFKSLFWTVVGALIGLVCTTVFYAILAFVINNKPSL